MCKPQIRSFLGGSRQPHFKTRKTTHMRHYKYQHDLEKSLVIASTKKWVISSSQVAMFLQKDVQIEAEASLGSWFSQEKCSFSVKKCGFSPRKFNGWQYFCSLKIFKQLVSGIHHDTPSKFLAGFPVATHDPQISVKSDKLQSRVYQTFLRNSHVFTSNLPPSAVEHQGTPDPWTAFASSKALDILEHQSSTLMAFLMAFSASLWDSPKSPMDEQYLPGTKTENNSTKTSPTNDISNHHLSIKTPMKPPSSSSVEILVNVSDGYNFHPRQKACIKCREGFQWILHRLFVGKPEPFALFIVAILSRARWNATQFFYITVSDIWLKSTVVLSLNHLL